MPFAELIDAGVPVVMLDHIAYASLDPDLPASLSPRAYELLREMGFEGVAITDSVGMGAVNLLWSFPESAVMAVAAGADAVLTTDGSQARGMRARWSRPSARASFPRTAWTRLPPAWSRWPEATPRPSPARPSSCPGSSPDRHLSVGVIKGVILAGGTGSRLHP